MPTQADKTQLVVRASLARGAVRRIEGAEPALAELIERWGLEAGASLALDIHHDLARVRGAVHRGLDSAQAELLRPWLGADGPMLATRFGLPAEISVLAGGDRPPSYGLAVIGALPDGAMEALTLGPASRAHLGLASSVLLNPPMPYLGVRGEPGALRAVVGLQLPADSGRVETLAVHRVLRGFGVVEPGLRFVRRYYGLLAKHCAGPAVCRLLVDAERTLGVELAFGRPSPEAVFLAPLKELASDPGASARWLGGLDGLLQSSGPIGLTVALHGASPPQLWLRYPVAPDLAGLGLPDGD